MEKILENEKFEVVKNDPKMDKNHLQMLKNPRKTIPSVFQTILDQNWILKKKGAEISNQTAKNRDFWKFKFWFVAKIGQISVDFGHKSKIEISKITIFGFWERNLCNFFFQNSVLVQNGSVNIRNLFFGSLWHLKMIFIHFWVTVDNIKKIFFRYFMQV